MNGLNKEKEKLNEVIKRFEKLIDEYKIKLKELPTEIRDNPYLLENYLSMYSNRLRLLEKTKGKPYFARIDFKIDNEDKINECYLGKIGVVDENNNSMTIDWRTPIASVYYDSNVGRTSYESPSGTITGDLLLKRQYDIENGELLDFRDVDTVSNDDILKPYLNVNADSRLKNIIASIQSEQNEIIREELNKNIIVQGVAGSGKTTVALHRVAYLVYNYLDNIAPEQYLVIGPNKFFINYISGVLPDLDVSNVRQLTYDELVQNYIKEKFTLLSSEKKLIESISNPNKLCFEKMKTSMIYKNALDNFMNDYMNNVFMGRDFEVNGYKIIDGSVIRKFFEETENNSLFKSNHKKQIDRVMILMEKYISNHQDAISSNVWKEYFEKVDKLSPDQAAQEMEKYQKTKKEIEKKFKSSIKKYFAQTAPKIIPLYYEFLCNIFNYIDINDYDIVEPLKETIDNIKKRKIEFEDLSALLYMKYKLQEPEDLHKFRHIVIDEAQDFGDFNFYVLKQMMSKASFSIFGDLTQSIYQYRGISDWDSVINKSFDKKCDIKYLLKSYRTTAEIMNEANNIVDHIGMKKSEPVIRHGANVRYSAIGKNQLNNIVNTINKYLENGYKSIAIITKTEEEGAIINKQLNKIGMNVENINSKNVEYKGGICTIPCYLAKGLEFDSVIISDASEKQYNSDKIIDMKLLYVAMTRALHELTILYSGELTLPLKDKLILEDSNEVKKKIKWKDK